MCSGTEAGSYLRLVDSCITQLRAQGPSRTCNESKEEEEGWELTILSIILSDLDMADECTMSASFATYQEGRCKATWKRQFKLLRRKAGPPNYLDDKVVLDR